MPFFIIPECTMKVTKDTVTISELEQFLGTKGHTVQLKDADPNELQLFIEKMPASIKEKMQDLREANSTRRTSELETGQLRDFQQREENFQRQLRDAQQREENLQRQFRELQEREQSAQRQLRESRQREQNLQRQLREVQEQEQGREENSQRQLRETRQQLRNCRGQVSELQLSLSTAQLTINQFRSQETRDWVISRDEIQITEKCLGRGGWGSVSEGTYCGCTVAVKQIYDLILSPHNIHLFEREMNIASECRHPHLLQFIGATKDEGTPLFVTELMEKSLRTLLEQRQLSETEIAVISLDVALALNYLHRKKPESIIHRDVSSANVLLWRQGDQWRGKVSDYGTANFIQQTMTVAPGAMIYSAPEALTSNQTVKVDVYSFGVLLCEMCIRQLPDPRRREEQVVLVTNSAFRGLVRRCLQREPRARPTMQEIIDQLKEFDANS
ncbi:probable serine/threonine-protein kinase drkA [Porites lutea]|uniref:probable serine/threonine-protein kinase drkA n=1 Tax=Porites lutea TaxID=51062 RepID=UPI003CC6BEF1